MRGKLAQHFRQRRQDQGLGLADLARLAGYRNIPKGCNKIQKFERSGEVHVDLLRKLADMLDIPDETVQELVEQDQRDLIQKWHLWANQPIQPHIVVRMVATVYKSEQLPDDVATLEEAESFAAETARIFNRRLCLVWTRRDSVWFDSEGNVETRTESAAGKSNVLHMRLKSNQRTFLLENSKSGETILRLKG